MKITKKRFLLICLLFAALLVLAGCSGKSVYDTFDEDGFNVSIRFDAGEGTLMDKTNSIVDSYNISNMKTNSKGEVEIALLDPTDERRGSVNICQPAAPKAGYYLDGWYAERTENPDGSYTYSKRWDFEKDRVCVPAAGEYSASEPFMTLYANWVPLFKLEIYDRATNTLMKTISYNPSQTEIQMPMWKEKAPKGTIDMNDMPEKEGYTYACGYYDLEGTQPIEDGTILKFENANPEEASRIYLDWMEGNWYHIYNINQLSRVAEVDGNYVICADLDFSGGSWPEVFMNNQFNGTFQTKDNAQFTIRNVSFSQKGAAELGLFKSIGPEASISNITFDNVTFTLDQGKKTVCKYGLVAASISDTAAISNVAVTNSKILISDHIADSETYLIGLVCAEGNYAAIDYSGITCEIYEDTMNVLPVNWTFEVEINGNDVNLKTVNN